MFGGGDRVRSCVMKTPNGIKSMCVCVSCVVEWTKLAKRMTKAVCALAQWLMAALKQISEETNGADNS